MQQICRTEIVSIIQLLLLTYAQTETVSIKQLLAVTYPQGPGNTNFTFCLFESNFSRDLI